MIQIPDPFSPGNYLTVRDPGFANRSGHEHCPICTKLRGQVLQQEVAHTEFAKAFALVDPDATLPPEPCQ